MQGKIAVHCRGLASKRTLAGPKVAGAAPKVSGVAPKVSVAGPKVSVATPKVSEAVPKISVASPTGYDDFSSTDRKLDSLSEDWTVCPPEPLHSTQYKTIRDITGPTQLESVGKEVWKKAYSLADKIYILGLDLG